MIDLQELCIQQDRLTWVLYSDLVCLNYDGNIIDASVVALTAALRNGKQCLASDRRGVQYNQTDTVHAVQLPSVAADSESGNPVIDPDTKRSLPIKCLPVATTFSIFDG